MQISTMYDITCNDCGMSASSGYGQGYFTSKREAQTWAKGQGWRVVQGTNRCGHCILIQSWKKRISRAVPGLGENMVIRYVVEFNLYEVLNADPRHVETISTAAEKSGIAITRVHFRHVKISVIQAARIN